MEDLLRVMKALSDPGRLRILKLLEGREFCACEIIRLLGLAQPTISRHMRILTEAGLVSGRKAGAWVRYRLAAPPADSCAGAMLAHLRTWLEDDPEVLRLRRLAANGAERACGGGEEGEARKMRVLFVCGRNSARSRMAEAWLKRLAGDRYAAESAGIERSPADPGAVAVMAERGMDIAARPSRTVEEAVAELASRGERFDAVITVCGKAAEACPVIPGVRITERWSFADPAGGGEREDGLRLARRVRDEIERAVRTWIARRAREGKKCGV